MSVVEYRVSEPDAGPYGLTAGPDGAVWFTEVHRGRIARLSARVYEPTGGESYRRRRAVRELRSRREVLD